jgi:osmotically-inducible protein OsmY
MTMNPKLALALLLVASGCADNPPPEPAATQPKVALRAMGQGVVAEETVSDESIGAEVRRLLDVQGPKETAGIVVEVDDAVVTLRGAAPTQAAAWRAESAAHSVKGAKLVRNQIIVNTPNPPP